MTEKQQVLEALKERFLGVHTKSLLPNNTIKSLRFLVDMIDKYKIDCSKYYLGCPISGNCFIPEQNVLCLRTNKMCGKKMGLEDSKHVILHELRHILQIQKGKLICDENGMTWTGKDPLYMPHFEVGFLLEFDPIAYDFLPWEIDADMFAVTSGEIDYSQCINKCIIRHYTQCKNRFPRRVK